MIIVLIVVFVALFVALPLAGLALWAVVSTAIVGLIIGGVARLIIPGRQPIGLLATLLLGLIGSILGSFIGREIGVGRTLTVLLEIGVAVVAVLAYVGYTRTALRRGGNSAAPRRGRA